jgi:hypothetical protein
MSGRETIALSDIERIKAGLEQMGPPKRQTATKQEAIAALRGPIAKMLKQGYRLEEIAKELNQNGLSMSVGVLRVYLRQAREDKRRRPKPVSRKQAQESAQGISEPQEPTETTEGNPEAP